MPENFKNMRVVVVGAGSTGQSLVRYFHRRGAEVALSDSRSAERVGPLSVPPGVHLDMGGHTDALFDSAQLVAISPGVPLSIPAVAAARDRGIPVWGEIEIAYGDLNAPIIAVTGTNGKSTTTTLLGEIFRTWGRKTFVGGNLGIPLIEAAEENSWDWIVAEISSFQLEAIRDFRPRYALLLNISEDHLDRYSCMDEYIAAKGRMFENLTENDVAVLNADDPRVLPLVDGLSAQKVLFSSRGALSEGMGFSNREIIWRHAGREMRFPADQLRIKGIHNVENVMAALIPPLLEGCPEEVAWRVACEFNGLEHRMVPVRTLDGTTWYNDSKGTNVGSVIKGLEGLAGQVTLIAGGKDKGGDYAPLIDPVRERVAHLILIGQAAERMDRELGTLTHTVHAHSLEDAVRLARELTPPGGSVLFSPGCSSFDMFRNFSERGDVYTRAVRSLQEREAH